MKEICKHIVELEHKSIILNFHELVYLLLTKRQP